MKQIDALRISENTIIIPYLWENAVFGFLLIPVSPEIV